MIFNTIGQEVAEPQHALQTKGKFRFRRDNLGRQIMMSVAGVTLI